jgi:hypothetical protein
MKIGFFFLQSKLPIFIGLFPLKLIQQAHVEKVVEEKFLRKYVKKVVPVNEISSEAELRDKTPRLKPQVFADKHSEQTAPKPKKVLSEK